MPRERSGGGRQGIDGRRLRSMRSRQRMIEAFLALLQEGNREPSAAAIASRGGCSVRTFFERFPAMTDLWVSAADYALSQAVALAPVRDLDGDRLTRIRSQVETRAATCERGLNLWRVLLAGQHRSDELKARVRLARDLVVQRLELMYGPELAGLPAAERSQLVYGLAALIEPESWAMLRDGHGLAFAEACGVWIAAVDRMLPPTPARR